jgi:hypothetical protein
MTDTLVVEKNVELPKTQRKAKYPFNTMEVGDSFIVECTTETRVATLRKLSAACASHSKRYGSKFTTHSVDIIDDTTVKEIVPVIGLNKKESRVGIRVWRKE